MQKTLYSVNFNWDDYMMKTGSIAAPQACFRQAFVPPQNDFKIGMKLEAQDPRNFTSVCIATIVGLQGPRLRLRLDGGDDKNDFWRLVDSSDIKTVGYCEKHEGMLQPPLGFRMNASSWPMFLLRTLSGADMAPAKFFKKEPPTPKSNQFKVGMKIEAVDRKNPHLICPATIGAVKDSTLFISFDGWRGAFDYNCEYDSRDIFPVGWCALTGHPLQMPGNKGQPKMRRASSSSSNNNNIERPLSVSPASTPTLIPPVSPARSTGKPEPDTSTQQLPLVNVYVNSNCNSGPYLNPQKKGLPPKIGIGPIDKMFKSVLQMCVDCAIQQKKVFSLFKQEPGGTIQITATYDGQSHSAQVRAPDTLHTFWNMVEKLCVDLLCCGNFLTAKPVQSSCPKCSKQDLFLEQSSSSLAVGGSNKATKRRWSSESGQQLDRESSRPKINKKITTEPASSTTSLIVEVKQETKPPEPRSADPTQWSIDDVMQFVSEVDPALARFSDHFKKHEIDGKAFFLLNSEMMMKYMGLKLGPAVKLSNLVEKLKAKKL